MWAVQRRLGCDQSSLGYGIRSSPFSFFLCGVFCDFLKMKIMEILPLTIESYWLIWQMLFGNALDWSRLGDLESPPF